MKKPFTYALGAALYIVLIVVVINNIMPALPQKSIFIPMVMLGLLVLSVAVMSFLFFSEPIYLYMDNQKKEAKNFFIQTVITFACFVALFVVALFVF